MNKLFFWNDLNIYIGDQLEADYHQHHAIQCCIALEGQLRIRSKNSVHWKPCTTAIIGSNVSHSISNPDGSICLIYLEKLSRNYRSILDYHCLKQQCEIKSEPFLSDYSIPFQFIDKAQHLQSAEFKSANSELLNETINDFKDDCISLFKGDIAKNNNIDARVFKLLRIINAEQQEVFNGAHLADTINLSESRMQHLFKQQVGIPIRRYHLWVRLGMVVRLAVSGVPLTEAAYSAGFSDSAHFSRTFKSMYGITASSLLSAKAGLQTFFCE